jgi:hypothetical protein
VCDILRIIATVSNIVVDNTVHLRAARGRAREGYVDDVSFPALSEVHGHDEPRGDEVPEHAPFGEARCAAAVRGGAAPAGGAAVDRARHSGAAAGAERGRAREIATWPVAMFPVSLEQAQREKEEAARETKSLVPVEPQDYRPTSYFGYLSRDNTAIAMIIMMNRMTEFEPLVTRHMPCFEKYAFLGESDGDNRFAEFEARVSECRSTARRSRSAR